MGNYLFCATTDSLTQNIDFTRPVEVSFEEIPDREEDELVHQGELPAGAGPVGAGLPAAAGLVRAWTDDEDQVSTDEEIVSAAHYNDSALDDTIRFFRLKQRNEYDSDDSDINLTFTQSQIDKEIGVPVGWESGDPDVYVYIDDANSVEKVRIPGSIMTISQNKQLVKIHAEKSEELFNNVALRASDIKMKVNDKKTQLLTISANVTSVISSYIRYGDKKMNLRTL